MKIEFSEDKNFIKIYIKDDVLCKIYRKQKGDKLLKYVACYTLKTNEYQKANKLYHTVYINIGFVDKFDREEPVFRESDAIKNALKGIFDKICDDLVKNGAKEYYNIRNGKIGVVKRKDNKEISIFFYQYYIAIILTEETKL